MESIQFTGKFKIEKSLKVIDPVVSVKSIFYDFDSGLATVTVLIENEKFSHSRELDRFAFTKELTIEDIKTEVQNLFDNKKDTTAEPKI
jgi:hypothetical protein